MPRNHFAKDSRAMTEVFLLPDIPQVGAPGKPDLRQIHGDLSIVPGAVEEAHSDAASAERLRLHIEIAILMQTIPLLAERVLVDADRIFVHQDGFV